MVPSFGCDERPGVFRNRRSLSTGLPTNAHGHRKQIDENSTKLGMYTIYARAYEFRELRAARSRPQPQLRHPDNPSTGPATRDLQGFLARHDLVPSSGRVKLQAALKAAASNQDRLQLPALGKRAQIDSVHQFGLAPLPTLRGRCRLR